MSYNNQIKHQSILVRIPRTGTTSIGRMLGIEDSHKTADELKTQAGSNWSSYFKYAFVRNPYDRFRSVYVALNYDKQHGDINEFLKDPDKWEEARKLHSPFLRPQCDYVCDENGEVMLDFIGRFEKLHEGWNYVFQTLKIKAPDKFMHLAKSERKKPKLTPASKDILYQIYSQDFEKFGYKR